MQVLPRVPFLRSSNRTSAPVSSAKRSALNFRVWCKSTELRRQVPVSYVVGSRAFNSANRVQIPAGIPLPNGAQHLGALPAAERPMNGGA